MNDHDYFLEAAAPAKESSCVEVIHVSSTPKFKMETRKNRTPSARMLASKIEEGTEKPASLTPVSSKPPTTVISQSNLAIQLSKAANLTPVPIRSIPVPSSMTATPLRPAEKEHTPGDEDIDISVHEMEESTTTKNNTRTTPMTPILLKEGKNWSGCSQRLFPCFQ
uniref:Uncharacterized protein n=1 Tax=Caenorhabditis japonica TaxID=281687 RepID=A0A8R1IKM0_CAEJA